jgi:hypothetical protein
MSIKDTILGTQPTSYWPLDDPGGSTCHDEMGLHDASAPANGVALAVIPFGSSQAPYFDGALGSVLTIDDDPQYSQPYANGLTVAAWICPLALDNANTTGGTDQYVHYIEKAVGPSTDTEWAMRLYNQTNPSRHSRLSFYTFNLTAPLNQSNEGNGSYMEPGRPRMTRRRSNSGNGFSWLARPSPGFRRMTSPRVASCGSRPSRRNASARTNTRPPAIAPPCVLNTDQAP